MCSKTLGWFASAEATASPEASPSAELKLDSFSLRVLNGSGEIGAASAGQKVIETAGFKVKATGNASSYDFEDTVIQVKEAVPLEVVSKLKEALANDYSVKVGETLKDTTDFDIVVTVGSK